MLRSHILLKRLRAKCVLRRCHKEIKQRSLRHLAKSSSISSGTSLKEETESNKIKAYIELAKPELSALVIMTGTWGFLLTGSSSIVACTSTVGGLVLAAASAASWNQAAEVPYDKIMVRTRTRPLPSGRLTLTEATTFSGVTGAAGVLALLTGTNTVTGTLGFLNIILYGMIYTPMKRKSIYNTHVGAVVGALPVVIGWTGGGGALLDATPAVLFSVMFAWQFPHFMGIAWKYRKDYKAAGYRMISRDDVNGDRTSTWAMTGALALCTVPFVSTAVGMTSSMFLVSSSIPNAGLVYTCYKFRKNTSSRNANKLILIGFIYLTGFLGLMFFHSTSEALRIHYTSLRNILRRVGKSFCVHETQIKKNPIPEMCPTSTSKVEKILDRESTTLQSTSSISKR